MNFGIIAAGLGSRLVEEGVSYPKPLVPLDGKPMIGRLIDIFIDCGAEEICLIVNEEMTEVRAYLEGKAQQCPCRLKIKVKSTPSSMHSFYEVASELYEKGRFIVTTVDTVFRPDDFKSYVEAFRSADSLIDGLMAVTPFIDDEKPLYVATDSSDFITGFYDENHPGVKFISGGIYGLSKSAMPVLKTCLEKGVSRMRNFQRALVSEGLRLKAYDIKKILDVDHASDIAKAEAFLGS